MSDTPRTDWAVAGGKNASHWMEDRDALIETSRTLERELAEYIAALRRTEAELSTFKTALAEALSLAGAAHRGQYEWQRVEELNKMLTLSAYSRAVAWESCHARAVGGADKQV